MIHINELKNSKPELGDLVDQELNDNLELAREEAQIDDTGRQVWNMAAVWTRENFER